MKDQYKWKENLSINSDNKRANQKTFPGSFSWLNFNRPRCFVNKPKTSKSKQIKKVVSKQFDIENSSVKTLPPILSSRNSLKSINETALQRKGSTDSKETINTKSDSFIKTLDTDNITLPEISKHQSSKTSTQNSTNENNLPPIGLPSEASICAKILNMTKRNLELLNMVDSKNTVTVHELYELQNTNKEFRQIHNEIKMINEDSKNMKDETESFREEINQLKNQTRKARDDCKRFRDEALYYYYNVKYKKIPHFLQTYDVSYYDM